MTWLRVALEIFVWLLAAWVVFFSVGLAVGLPIFGHSLGFALVVFVGAVRTRRHWAETARRCGPGERRFALGVIGLGCAIGALVLVTARPDADDVGYLHQPLLDARSAWNPFTVDPFLVPLGERRISVPFLAENEAFEALVVVSAKATRIPTLLLYHNISAFLLTVLFVAVYALLFRQFGIRRRRVWVALLATLAFLFLDGDLHRSFGNFGPIRIWQGKTVAWQILGPAFLYFGFRFLRRPGASQGALLGAIGIAGFAINRSSILLFVALSLALGVAHLATSSRRDKGLSGRSALWLLAAMLPLWILGLYLSSVVLPTGSTIGGLLARWTTMIGSGAEESWQWLRPTYHMVIGDLPTLFRDLVLVLVVPILSLRAPLGRFLACLSLVLLFVGFSPVSGPILHAVANSAHWRLYLALPVPLCVGLATNLWARGPLAGRSIITRLAVAAAACALVTTTIHRPVLAASNGVHWKAPWHPRLDPVGSAVATSLQPELEGRLVLAPNRVSNVLAVTETDSIDLVFGRIGAGRVDAALDRCKARQDLLDNLWRLAQDSRADILIVRICHPRQLARLRRTARPVQLREIPMSTPCAAEYRAFVIEWPETPPAPLQ